MAQPAVRVCLAGPSPLNPRGGRTRDATTAKLFQHAVASRGPPSLARSLARFRSGFVLQFGPLASSSRSVCTPAVPGRWAAQMCQTRWLDPRPAGSPDTTCSRERAGAAGGRHCVRSSWLAARPRPRPRLGVALPRRLGIPRCAEPRPANQPSLRLLEGLPWSVLASRSPQTAETACRADLFLARLFLVSARWLFWARLDAKRPTR